MFKSYCLRGALLLLYIPLLQQSGAQWSTTLEHPSGRSGACHGLELDNGSFVVVTLSGEFRSVYSRFCDLIVMDEEGLVTQERQITSPDRLPIVHGLHLSETSGDFLLPGTSHDTLDFQAPSSSSISLWTLNAELTNVNVFSASQGARNHTLGSSSMDSQGNCYLAAVAYDFVEGSVQAVVAAKWNPTGTVLAFDTVVQYQGIGKAHDLKALPDGRMALLAFHASDSPPGTGPVGLFKLDNDLTVSSVDALHCVDPTQTFGLNAPFDQLDILPLPSGNFIVGGTFNPFMDGQWRSVIQLTDDQAQPIGQHVISSPYVVDFAALSRCLDMAPDGTFLFSQTQNFQGTHSVEGEFGEPSRVLVTRLDTSLQVLEEYLFDGFADGHYYLVNGVLNARDGGAFVYGHSYDLGTPPANRRRDAWVAKISADQFVGVQQKEAPMLTLFPNPGQNSFILSLDRPAYDLHVRLFDTQGRLAHTQHVSGLNLAVDATGLASGLYAVQLTDPNRTVVASGRWLKE